MTGHSSGQTTMSVPNTLMAWAGFTGGQGINPFTGTRVTVNGSGVLMVCRRKPLTNGGWALGGPSADFQKWGEVIKLERGEKFRDSAVHG